MKRKHIPFSDNLKAIFESAPLAASATPEWLSEERKACKDLILQQELPGQGLEAWKYTDVSSVNKVDWRLPSLQHPPEGPAELNIPSNQDDCVLHITILNGCYLPTDTPLPIGVEIRNLAEPQYQEDIRPILQRTNYRFESVFSAMNRAIWQGGICIDVAAGTKATLHIHTIYGEEDAAVLCAPRIHLKAGAHSQLELTLSQWNRNIAPVLGTPCVDLDLMAGAYLTYAHEQLLNSSSLAFTTTRIALERDASLHAIDLALGASLSRHDLSLILQESGSEATLNGVYLLRDRQTADFHTRIEHRKPYSKSRQVYKGVLEDHAHAVFNGLVEVHPGAMGTDGYQLSRTLLRSPNAVIDTKPELQIHNDDVRCSHGATVGQIDPLELFYLQSRCIPTDIALAILSRAFVLDLIQEQPSAYQRERLTKSVKTFFSSE